ncbi:MAG: hypothetical protein JNJ47_00555, partial [Alphaproteobacteria bacterium]|nr:hypothetical protein [Alphaproteobacteria bacterium]
MTSSIKAVVQDVSQSTQLEVNVTLYPQDMALIKERRKAWLTEGSNKLLIKDVPEFVLMNSFLFELIPPSSLIKVLEYNYQSSDITREKLLEHSVGEIINILPLPSRPVPFTGTLLSLDGEDEHDRSGPPEFRDRYGRPYPSDRMQFGERRAEGLRPAQAGAHR